VSGSQVFFAPAFIAKKGGLCQKNYRSRHGIGFADALIAATAELKQAKLVTLNERHFPMLDVYVPYGKD
jgi:predicted nucleic acid-binding protein